MKTSTKTTTMRRALLAAAAALLLPVGLHAQAAWPNRPIRIIVPFPPGGSNDILSRVIADKLTSRLGQGVIVENKGGAAGTIGTDYVAKAAPDGYTLLFASGSITTNAASGKKLPYDLANDLQPIGLVGAGPFVVVTTNSLPVKNLQEFIDLARSKPRSISYGTPGIGGINHLGTELFANAAKIEMVHVPYKGIGPAFSDLIGGNLQMAIPTLSSMNPFLTSGKMRILATTGKQRAPQLPDVPTVSEAGLPGFSLEVWWALLGPAKLPPAITKRLNEELNAILVLPEVRDVLAREGASTTPGTPEALRDVIRTDTARWTKLIKDTGLVLE